MGEKKLGWSGDEGKASCRYLRLCAMKFKARRESGYENTRAASLAPREFIEESSAWTPPVTCAVIVPLQYSTTTQTYREGTCVAELRIDMITT